MIQINCADDYRRVFPSRFLKELDIYLYSTLHRDDDLLILVDGYEGSGKSVFMRCLGDYCTRRAQEWGFKLPSFGIDNIHFELDSYISTSEEKNKEGKKGFVNVLDESRKVANRRMSRDKDLVRFTDFMSECRSSNQVHLIGLPTYHDIDSNIAVWRQKFIINVQKRYVPNNDPNIPVNAVLERGYFRVYSDTRAIINTFWSREKYVYPRRYDFSGVMEFYDPLVQSGTLHKYDEKKAEARHKKYVEQEKAQEGGGRRTEQRDNLIKLLSQFGYTDASIAKFVGLGKQRVYQITREPLSNELFSILKEKQEVLQVGR